MKLKFPLLVLCIHASLLVLFAGRSNGGVSKLCKEGKFFDSSKQKYVPCHECKSKVQQCFSCCESAETEIQDEGSNARNLSSSNTPPQAKDVPGVKKEKSLPSEADKYLPNILVVSTISVFMVASLLVLLLIVIRSSLGRGGEARDGMGTSDSQRSDVVTEVMMVEFKDETNDSRHATGDGHMEGKVRTVVTDVTDFQSIQL
ncbi:hypothetical protein OS493_013208 [Desmophyllum pertusum]|uniref:Uncharacterized protein n=1 Tax=Desmophyllum pertusum TaxID=174260 RepID=A0A9W9YQ45_9CNID|nr:hypothetical protein OS493_013208 [Desmophyllum pertusum]